MKVLSDFTWLIKEHVRAEETEILKMKRGIKERDEQIENMFRVINVLKEARKGIVSLVGITGDKPEKDSSGINGGPAKIRLNRPKKCPLSKLYEAWF